MTLFETLQSAWPYLVDGFRITIEIWIFSILIGVVLGLIACLMKMSKFKILQAISGVYVWLIRGTPMIVQAFVVYFGLSQAAGLHLSPFTAGMITLSLNAGAYLSEIFRSGIQAVPKGQTEAARSLGLGAGRTMAKIVLPQAFKIAIPPMVTTPHFKKVYRIFEEDSGKAIADLITVYDEQVDPNAPLELFDPDAVWKRKTIEHFQMEELLVPVFQKGELVYDLPDIETLRQRCARELDRQWDEVKRFENPHNYYVDLSQKLWDIKAQLLKDAKA